MGRIDKKWMAVQGVANWSQICSLNVVHWSGIDENLVRIWSAKAKVFGHNLVIVWSSVG